MYISRSRWKTFCIAVLISLLGLFLFTRGPLRLYDRAESVKDLALDDPVESLLTEDDLTRGSEAAINATLGVSYCGHHSANETLTASDSFKRYWHYRQGHPGVLEGWKRYLRSPAYK